MSGGNQIEPGGGDDRRRAAPRTIENFHMQIIDYRLPAQSGSTDAAVPTRRLSRYSIRRDIDTSMAEPTANECPSPLVRTVLTRPRVKPA